MLLIFIFLVLDGLFSVGELALFFLKAGNHKEKHHLGLEIKVSFTDNGVCSLLSSSVCRHEPEFKHLLCAIAHKNPMYTIHCLWRRWQRTNHGLCSSLYVAESGSHWLPWGAAITHVNS